MKTNAVTALLSRLAGMFLLVVFGAGQMQLLPLITVMAAEADGGHSVEVCASRSGVQIVLHHQRAGGLVPPGHTHHGLLSILAGDGGSGAHPDHEFTFAAGSGAAEDKTRTAEVRGAKTEMAKAESHSARPQLLLSRTAPAAGAVLTTWWPPTPADCAWGRTVLLI